MNITKDVLASQNELDYVSVYLTRHFMASVGGMLNKAREAARSKAHGLTVFGEMVTVLWDEGKKEAALQLEALERRSE